MSKYSAYAGASIAVIAIGTFLFSRELSARPVFETVAASRSRVAQGISANGIVQAAQDLKLSFQGSGTISSVSVRVGDQVKQGQVLARLDAKNVRAGLDQANAGLSAARANYQKVLAGSSSEDISVAQVALDNATAALANTKEQQDVLVKNALSTMLNSGLAAVADRNNPDAIAPTVTGTYTGTEQGSYQVNVFNGGGGMRFSANGLETADGLISVSPQALGAKGLYLQYSSTPSIFDRWTITIPNTLAASYIPNYNAYQAALQTRDVAVSNAKAAVDSAQAALILKKAQARPADIAAAQAQIATAEAAVEAAQNNYDDTSIVAPIAGTVSSVDAKIGQIAGAGTPEIGLISDQEFQVAVYISENDVNKVTLNDAAQVTLSAYGDQTVFPATVIDISPDANAAGGISGYKITLQFNQADDRIRSGMAAHVDVTDLVHDNALAVPASGLFTDNGNSFVLVQDGLGATRRQPVQVGLHGLDNSVEITGGLQEGQRVIYFGK